MARPSEDSDLYSEPAWFVSTFAHAQTYVRPLINCKFEGKALTAIACQCFGPYIGGSFTNSWHQLIPKVLQLSVPCQDPDQVEIEKGPESSIIHRGLPKVRSETPIIGAESAGAGFTVSAGIFFNARSFENLH